MSCKVCASPHLEPAPLPEEATAGHMLHWCRDCGFVSLTGAPSSLHGRSDDAATDPRSLSRRAISRIRFLGLHRWLKRLTRISHQLPTAAGDAPAHSGAVGTGPSQRRSRLEDLTSSRRRRGASRGSGHRILDAGAGLGDLSLDLMHHGWDVWACDAAEDAARACAPLLSERFVAARFEEADLPEAFFDVVMLNFSLEHMDGPRHAARRISDLLRPGGVVAIRVPNIDAALSGRKGAGFQLHLPHHRSFYGPKSLRRLLEDAGLQVLEITTPLTLLEGVSTACDLAPTLDPDRWIHRPATPLNLLRGAALATLATLALPGAWSRCRDGEGVILYAGARKMVER